jgi:hypothetical protein
MPPLASTATMLETFAITSGRAIVAMTSGPPTRITNGCDAVCGGDAVSVNVMVNENVPAAVGTRRFDLSPDRGSNLEAALQP